jgi:hypothetical protein
MKMEEPFGTVLGTAARVFSAIAHAEEDVPQEWRSSCTYYFPDGCGSGFIFNAVTWFPELSSLKKVVEKTSQLPSFRDAKSAYEIGLSRLAVGCGCLDCTKQERQPEGPESFCLVSLAEIIIKAVRLFSGILTDRNHIRPMRSGLELLYLDHWVRHAGFWSEPGTSWLHRIIHSRDYRSNRPLEYSALIFSGDRSGSNTSHIGEDMAALADSGLCYFLDILRDPTSSPAKAARINIVAGHIMHLGRRYSSLTHRLGGNIGLSGKNCVVSESFIGQLSAFQRGDIEMLIRHSFGSTTHNNLDIEFGIKEGNMIIGSFTLILSVAMLALSIAKRMACTMQKISVKTRRQFRWISQNRITGNSTSESRHEQFPFPSLDLSSCCFNLSKPEVRLSRA